MKGLPHPNDIDGGIPVMGDCDMFSRCVDFPGEGRKSDRYFLCRIRARRISPIIRAFDANAAKSRSPGLLRLILLAWGVSSLRLVHIDLILGLGRFPAPIGRWVPDTLESRD